MLLVVIIAGIKMTTKIVIIDEPCGSGKSTGLIAELKHAIIAHPDAKFMVVLPTLDEIDDRFLPALGDRWCQPEVGDTEVNTKRESIVKLMTEGRSIVTTHALYEDIRAFKHLLSDYHVIIDEVPTTAEQVTVKFGAGIFDNLIYKQKYIDIDSVTSKITVTPHWAVHANAYKFGDDLHIKQFMDKVIWSDVYYVRGVYCVMPLPDAFFTKPKTLTILTFLFEGTQLDQYMKLRGYHYTLKTDPKQLMEFKQRMARDLAIWDKNLKFSTGYTVMTGKDSQRRKQVGHFVKRTVQELRKLGQQVNADRVLVGVSKDAWWGREKNPSSKVTNATRLKSLTKLGSAEYTSLVTRGTNRHRERYILLLLGKLNMNPNLSEFLGMTSKKARDQFVLSELIQLLYRTAIREEKPTLLVSADKENLRLLEAFLKGVKPTPK